MTERTEMKNVHGTKGEIFVLANEIRNTLIREKVAHVRWTPGNGTAYELLLIPWEATRVMMLGTVERPQLIGGGEDGPGWVYIARGYLGALHPIRLWDIDGEGRCPYADYLAEKLADRSMEDGHALNLLLSAVADCKPTSTYAQAGF